MEDNEKLKHCLVGMYKRFVEQVDPRSVLDYLIEKRVISIEDKDRITSSSTRQDRCRSLLDHIFTTSNPRACVFLKEALEEHYLWIAEELARSLSRRQNGCQERSSAIRNSIRNSATFKEAEVKLVKLESTVQQLKCRIMELEVEVEAKTDVENKLRNHINILEFQIETAAETIMRSNNLLNAGPPLDEVDGKSNDSKMRSLSSDIVSMTFADNFPKFSIEECKIIGSTDLKKLKKLPKYCQPSYDLWIGHLEGSKNIVCIKELINSQQKAEFFSEVLLLQKLRHPRIANFLGRSPSDSPEAFIVFESTPLTNVYNFFKSPHCMAISNDAILQWVIQLSCGLEYMHYNRILHRSIFTSNILLCNSAYSIKITNFQNATILGAKDYVLEIGSLARAEKTAPEIISENKWSFATDVWSFGLTALKMFVKGKKIFPEMTQKDIKNFLTSAGDEDMELFLHKHLQHQQKMKETIRKCLRSKEADRPEFSSLTSFSSFKTVNNTNTFAKKNRFEHTIVHKNPVRGITSLGGVLYAIFMSSSAIKCYDIANGLLKLKSIKLGPTAKSTFKSYFNNKDLEKIACNVSIKPFKFCSNNLKSLASCAHAQCLYVLDVGQLVVFQVSTVRRKVMRSWKVSEDANCISVTHYGSILVSCCSPDCSALEYSSEGMVLSKISRGEISDGPWKSIKMDEMHYLMLHGSIYSTSDRREELCVVDHDGVKSSGYGYLAFGNLSDVTVHKASKSILLALPTENKILRFNQYLSDHPVELLNINDGISAPSRIHSTDHLLFVGLTSGNIYCFQFS